MMTLLSRQSMIHKPNVQAKVKVGIEGRGRMNIWRGGRGVQGTLTWRKKKICILWDGQANEHQIDFERLRWDSAPKSRIMVNEI